MDILFANDRAGEYPPSWYAYTAAPPGPYARAEGALSCDVCIVGAGFTGLSAALHLAGRGYDVILLDAHRVGWGASGRNGGQVGTGQRLDQEALEDMVGLDHARRLWELAQEAVTLTKDLAAAHAPDAGYAPGIIHACHRARLVPHARDYSAKMARGYGYDLIRPLDRDEIRHLVGSPAYYGGDIDMGGGHLHPLRYAFGLARAAAAKGVRIFERSTVTGLTELAPATVTTETATITAAHVILACNGYLGRLQQRVTTCVMPINNFIVATEPMTPEVRETFIRGNHAVADSKFVINYFRFSHDHRLLFGGAESYGYRFPKDIAALVRKPMTAIFPQLRDVKITHAWGGTLGITMNRMPHFEQLAGNVLSVSGYSGHGVAMATLGGKLAAEAVAGQAERFDLMASVPTRPFPGGIALRWPLLVLAMVWFSIRDRL
ncbi:Gamma-glutamylputrescine oxidoreductase [Defluviimonas aquaemixtae]|uniref:Gamma-glutamylputrescine oxidoreductase n=1 Tax=Albidovulum aquaemixtae TaxID=1542388 RepID=A0A2R8B7N3_9RHOB|nr:FAD-binding oxidoreductase [Defluviimonas aquaemixtae]SPH18569.1 Gamma-glutamylputrescine oxidoreductase [Defluviimonas aquaemixtae]